MTDYHFKFNFDLERRMWVPVIFNDKTGGNSDILLKYENENGWEYLGFKVFRLKPTDEIAASSLYADEKPPLRAPPFTAKDRMNSIIEEYGTSHSVNNAVYKKWDDWNNGRYKVDGTNSLLFKKESVGVNKNWVKIRSRKKFPGTGNPSGIYEILLLFKHNNKEILIDPKIRNEY